jgi:hypothetical protein
METNRSWIPFPFPDSLPNRPIHRCEMRVAANLSAARTVGKRWENCKTFNDLAVKQLQTFCIVSLAREFI